MSRLRHLCRRGLHELDFLLQGLEQRAMSELCPGDQARLEELLAEAADPLLLDWLLGRAEPPQPSCDLVIWLRHGAMATAS